MKKPWRIACTRNEMLTNLDMTCSDKNGLCCSGVTHAKCQGVNTMFTEGYTDMIVMHIHVNFSNIFRRRLALSPPPRRASLHSSCLRCSSAFRCDVQGTKGHPHQRPQTTGEGFYPNRGTGHRCGRCPHDGCKRWLCQRGRTIPLSAFVAGPTGQGTASTQRSGAQGHGQGTTGAEAGPSSAGASLGHPGGKGTGEG